MNTYTMSNIPGAVCSSKPSWKQATDPSLFPTTRHPEVAATLVIVTLFKYLCKLHTITSFAGKAELDV